MCCVCDFICRLISGIVSLIFIVGIVLLILWLTGVIGPEDEGTSVNVTQQAEELTRQISPKFFGVADKAD